MSAGRTKLIRFETKAQKERIERAAREQKRSVNQFMLMAAEEKVWRVAAERIGLDSVSGLANTAKSLAEAEGLR